MLEDFYLPLPISNSVVSIALNSIKEPDDEAAALKTECAGVCHDVILCIILPILNNYYAETWGLHQK